MNFQKSSNYAAAADDDYGSVVILYTSPSVIKVIKSRTWRMADVGVHTKF
jgi:hypothetical protein